MKSVAVAPAKVILTGEHFVVYGTAAIVTAVEIHSKATVSWRRDGATVIRSSLPKCAISINEGQCEILLGEQHARTLLEPISLVAQATLKESGDQHKGLNVQIESNIPVGVGLGSSAAVAVSTIAAIVRLLSGKLDRKLTRRLAFESERHVHKIPSGIDQTVSTYGGVIVYQREKPFKHVVLRRAFPIIIGDTGIRRSTGDIVSRVKAFLAERDTLMKRVMKSANLISRRALVAVQQADRKRLGELMNLNHELLRQIEVSTKELDQLVSAAREAGAFGAKLTGAGGGGCMIALASPDNTNSVLEAIREAGGNSYLANIERRGVKSWLLD